MTREDDLELQTLRAPNEQTSSRHNSTTIISTPEIRRQNNWNTSCRIFLAIIIFITVFIICFFGIAAFLTSMSAWDEEYVNTKCVDATNKCLENIEYCNNAGLQCVYYKEKIHNDWKDKHYLNQAERIFSLLNGRSLYSDNGNTGNNPKISTILFYILFFPIVIIMACSCSYSIYGTRITQ